MLALTARPVHRSTLVAAPLRAFVVFEVHGCRIRVRLGEMRGDRSFEELKTEQQVYACDWALSLLLIASWRQWRDNGAALTLEKEQHSAPRHIFRRTL